MALLNAYATLAAHSTPNFPSTLQDPWRWLNRSFAQSGSYISGRSADEGRDAKRPQTATESLFSAALIENDPSADT